MRTLFLPVAIISAANLLSAQATAPVIVSGEWLAPKLTDPAVAVLHVATNRLEYEVGHLPGARFVVFSSLAPSLAGFSTQLPTEAQLDSVLEMAGVSDNSQVVIYGQPLQVARAFVTLEYAGLAGRVSVLDGGVESWRESGRSLSQEAVTPARGTLTLKAVPAMVADAPWIQANTARPTIALIDARTPEFYLGFSAGSTPRAGHIPNALNLPFSSLTSELTTMREEAKVRRLFENAGAARGDTVVAYCHVGLQASLVYLNARRLGYAARIYDGSYEDWSRNTALPVVVKKP